MTDWLSLPFFEQRHRALAERLERWCWEQDFAHAENVDGICRRLVCSLGAAGHLQPCIEPDVRSLAVARATLAWHSGLADFAFAMQGLGSGAIAIAGSPDQKEEWLPKVAAGDAIAAFALTEPDTGSDAANIAMRAEEGPEGWLLTGEKSYISNGTIADLVTVFARSDGEGHRGISAFIVRGDDAGLSVAERIAVIAPHPLARLRFERVRAELIGNPGEGFRIAMQTLTRFRVSVGAAALGFGQRALDETLRFIARRKLGTGMLADNAVTQASLAEMVTSNDASALLIARAAWTQDSGADDRRTAAIAKLHATEHSQKVIDMAVQLHGGLGVTVGVKVEELYREIRALRIYEGASEVQRQIIARDVLKEART